MSTSSWDEIAQRTEASRIHAAVERSSKRVRLTAEVFTPSDLVCRLLRLVPSDALGPGRTVLDPACGDGQFLYAVKMAKMLIFGMTEDAALSELYGVDIVAQNVDLCRKRLGGGYIAVGNSLIPCQVVADQTDADRKIMSLIFSTAQPSLF